MSRALTIHIVTSNAQTTLQHEHTIAIAKLATRHLTMAIRGEHVLASYPDWPGYEANTCMHLPLVSVSYFWCFMGTISDNVLRKST